MFKILLRTISTITFVFLFTACSIPLKQHRYDLGYREAGIASWYGKDFHGRPTASGEIYDMYDISAAHKTLPLGSLLLVTHMETGNQVKVKINDRGPFVPKRIIDLSYGAAKVLGIVGSGIAKVEIQLIGRSPIFLPGSTVEKKFFVQVGSYQLKKNAHHVKRKVAKVYPGVSIGSVQTELGRLYRVQLGPYETEAEARSSLTRFRSRNPLSEGMTPIVITNQ